jgi:hypothetical protein
VLVDIYADGSFVCAICDFGFSNVIGDDRKIGSVSGLLSPQTAGLTARYASPEVREDLTMKIRRYFSKMEYL